jgi:hypothetical protein
LKVVYYFSFCPSKNHQGASVAELDPYGSGSTSMEKSAMDEQITLLLEKKVFSKSTKILRFKHYKESYISYNTVLKTRNLGMWQLAW